MPDVSALRIRRLVLAVSIVLWYLAAPAASLAQDNWISVTTPNFTVLSNGSERSTKAIAQQLERVRLAINSTWPWARVQLDRPVVVLAAKDEQTMKLLAPEYWERGSQIKPTSVFAPGPDRYYITLRADVKADDTPDENPYHSAYWSYVSLLLNEAFDPPLPLWLRNGLAGVLANSIVRDTWVEFGRPFSSYVRTFAGEPHLTVANLLTMTADAPYYRNSIERYRFDSQSWAMTHYLLYGRPEANANALNNIVTQLRSGKTSADAVQGEFGDLSNLDEAVGVYVQNGLFKYERVQAANDINEQTLKSARMSPVDVRVARLGLHVAMNNAVAARTMLAETTKQGPASPAWLDAEGMLFDREGKPEEARQAYDKAADLGSTNAFVLYRSAALGRPTAGDTAGLLRREELLKRAVAANPRMANAHALLADTYSSTGRRDEALASARTAVTLAPRSAYTRMALARAMWNAGQRDGARGHLMAARSLTDNEQERAAVQSMIDGFDRASQPASSPGVAAALPAAAATPAAPSTSAAAPSSGDGPQPAGPPAAPTARRRILDLRPVGTGETRVLGMFQAIECRAAGDGRVALVVEAAGKVMRFAATGIGDVDFVSFRGDTPTQVNCSPFAKPYRALVTYRTDAILISGADGTAVAIELIPDDFTPPQ